MMKSKIPLLLVLLSCENSDEAPHAVVPLPELRLIAERCGMVLDELTAEVERVRSDLLACNGAAAWERAMVIAETASLCAPQGDPACQACSTCLDLAVAKDSLVGLAEFVVSWPSFRADQRPALEGLALGKPWTTASARSSCASETAAITDLLTAVNARCTCEDRVGEAPRCEARP